jgi:hypothetical protein
MTPTIEFRSQYDMALLDLDLDLDLDAIPIKPDMI